MRGRPEDQDAQVLFDVVEPMLNPGRHEDKTARLHPPILLAQADGAATADHVVDLVLLVRSLAVGRAARPDRQTNAQLVRSEKVDVAVTFGIARLGVELRNLECFHSSAQ